jgi:hypothetical protein
MFFLGITWGNIYLEQAAQASKKASQTFAFKAKSEICSDKKVRGRFTFVFGEDGDPQRISLE